MVAIDPGSRRAGYAVFDVKDGGSKLFASGVISVKGSELPQRLLSLHRDLKGLFRRHKPEEVAVERAFIGKSAASGIILSSARAICLLAAAEIRAEVFDYAPAQVKKAVWPNGRATKATIQRAVQLHLDLKESPPPDEADAIALGLCHLHRTR